MRSTAAVAAAAAVLVVTSLTAGPSLPAGAGVNTWDTPVTISAAGQSASTAQVVTDGGIITSVWLRSDGSTVRVQASTSANKGITWSTPVYLSEAGRYAFFPQLVTDGSTITAIWTNSDGSNDRVQASTSDNNGVSWSTPAPLSAAGQNAFSPQLVTDGSTITAIWARSDGSTNRIQASTSTDGGTTWSTPADLSAAGQFASSAQVASDGSTITAIWSRSDGSNTRVQSSSSVDRGTTWSAPTDLSVAGQNIFNPQVATDGRTVTAVWELAVGINYRIQVSSSVDSGVTWSAPTELSSAAQTSINPQVVTDGRAITAVWVGNNRVEASSSLDGGTAWTTPVALSAAGEFAVSPEVVTDGRTVTAVWSRSDGSKDRVQASSSVNGGTTWSTPVDLSAAGQDAVNSQLVTDGSTATVVWQRSDGTDDRIQVSSSTSPREPGRLAGANRYLTAVEISKQFPANVPVVYLAAGTNFPDALSASSAAAVQEGPLLLTDPTALPDGVGQELQRLNPTTVVIAGGTSAVSDAVRIQVQALLPTAVIRRDSGTSRYATSRALASNAFSLAPLVFVATGANFPDALSASAAAGAAGAPVILIDGSATNIDQPTRDLFTQLGTGRVIVAGGTGAVRPEIQTALNTLFGPTNVTRLSGADRYATGVAVNQARFVVAPTVFLATGTGFADALAGAALAGRDKGPLYVVPGTCVPPSVLDELSRLKVNRVTLFGGTGVLTPAVQTLTPC